MHWNLGEAGQRKDWFSEMGFTAISSSQALAKQKLSILDMCKSGLVYKVEAAILKAVDFPSHLGTCKIELQESSLNFKATFDDGHQQSVKEFQALKKANDWLVMMTCAYKKGEINKQTRRTENDVRAEASFEKARDSCLPAGGGSLAASLTMSPSHQTMESGAVDVTESILRPPRKSLCLLPSSTSQVHKGSLQSFIKLGASEPTACGLLFGKRGGTTSFM